MVGEGTPECLIKSNARLSIIKFRTVNYLSFTNANSNLTSKFEKFCYILGENCELNHVLHGVDAIKAGDLLIVG